MNILILLAGDNVATDGQYPLCLSEVNGKTILEHLLSECADFPNAKITCLAREEDVAEHHLDKIIQMLGKNKDFSVLTVKSKTQGALCTTLLASHIDVEESLLILSGNELIKKNLQSIVEDFEKRKLDAGTVVFHSIHPRYSFVKLNEENLVVEAAEKNPISQHATAGFYWFKSGKDFVNAAKNTLIKNAHVNGLFYICPVFNELILEQKRVGVFFIENQHYLPMKSTQQYQQVVRAL